MDAREKILLSRSKEGLTSSEISMETYFSFVKKLSEENDQKAIGIIMSILKTHVDDNISCHIVILLL